MTDARCPYCGSQVQLGQSEGLDVPVCGPDVLIGLVSDLVGNVQQGSHYQGDRGYGGMVH